MDNKELDIWLAENVMGWRSHKLSPKVWIDDIIKYTIPKSEWRPTQNIDQAVMALEKLFEGKKWDFELFYSSSESFSDKEKDHFYLADTIRLEVVSVHLAESK